MFRIEYLSHIVDIPPNQHHGRQVWVTEYGVGQLPDFLAPELWLAILSFSALNYQSSVFAADLKRKSFCALHACSRKISSK